MESLVHKGDPCTLRTYVKYNDTNPFQTSELWCIQFILVTYLHSYLRKKVAVNLRQKCKGYPHPSIVQCHPTLSNISFCVVQQNTHWNWLAINFTVQCLRITSKTATLFRIGISLNIQCPISTLKSTFVYFTFLAIWNSLTSPFVCGCFNLLTANTQTITLKSHILSWRS